MARPSDRRQHPSLRITGGQLVRRRIAAPPGVEIRPTTDRVREAIFSSLQARLDFAEARVLDVFAGSGALGFEAISRGCRHVTFVDSSAAAVDAIDRNASELEVAERCEIVMARGEEFLASYRGSPFDVVLADPPYRYETVPEILALCRRVTVHDGWVVLEHASNRRHDDAPGFLLRRKYGRTSVSYFEAER